MSLQLVALHGKKETTTSLIVAERFSKKHNSVLMVIEKMECPRDFTERNFALSEYTDSTGRTFHGSSSALMAV